MPSLYSAAMLGLSLLSAASASPTKTSACSEACNPSTVTVTIATHTFTAGEDIFSVAANYSVGVCDLARYNVMADAVLTYTGLELLIPEQTCPEDNISCLVKHENYTADCIYGGPHVYTTELNDTLVYIAAKLQISLESLQAAASTNDIASNTSIITEGSSLKIPQCYPSVCDVEPYSFLYGVYKDLAEQYGSTVGQIQAFNPQYNHSPSGNDGTGPTISIPKNCRPLSTNITVIS